MNNWTQCVKPGTDSRIRKVASDRGYSEAFIHWLATKQLIGLFPNNVAFPVFGQTGEAVGCHYRIKPGVWRYHWFTSEAALQVVTPLVIGDPKNAAWAFVFESQWDAFAVMSTYQWETKSERYANGCVVITRGAENGHLVEELLPSSCEAYLWKQNDPPRENGKMPAADKWLADIQQYAGCSLHQVVTPPQHKDPNEWLLAGATGSELEKAVNDSVAPAPSQQRGRQKSIAEPDWLALGFVDEPDLVPSPFPTESLPKIYAAMVNEVARVNRVSEGLAAMVALATVSASLGSTLTGRLFQDKITRPNLYLLGAVPSGEGKSTTATAMLKPFSDHDFNLREDWKQNRWPSAKARQATIKKSIDQLQSEAGKSADAAAREHLVAQIAELERALEKASADLVSPSLMIEDVTTEKLAVELLQNEETLALISSDGGDVIANIMGRYRKNSVDDSLYVKAWSGDQVSVSRLNRPPVNLRSPCLMMLLLVQPAKLDRLFSKQQLIDGGMLPRFLMTCLASTPTKVSVDLVEMKPDIVDGYHVAVDELVTTYRLAEKPVVIESTREAQEVIVDYYNQITERRGSDLKDVAGFAARWHEQACRIALILHAAEHGANAGNTEIQADTARSAVRVTEWFVNEQLIILNSHRTQSLLKDLREVWLFARALMQGFTVRDLVRKKMFRTANAAESVLNQMLEKGLMEQEPVDTGGRPSVRWKLKR